MGIFVLAATTINQDVAPLSDLNIVFKNVVQSVLTLAGITLFIMLLLGGYKYITSGGDPKNAESAKLTLTYAIGGLILVASAYLILRFIGEFTGVNTILQFNVVRP